MADDPGAYEVGSAYVSVSPDAETFAEQLEEQIGDPATEVARHERQAEQ